MDEGDDNEGSGSPQLQTSSWKETGGVIPHRPVNTTMDKLRRHRSLLVAVLKLVLIVMVLPGMLAALGYIVEAIIYKPGRRPGFHCLHFALAGWIAAPLILIRLLWRWPAHLTKLEFVVFVGQTVAFFIAIDRISLTGNDIYQSNLMLRQDFRSDLFEKVTNEEAVWRWLRAVMQYVYDRPITDNTTIISRRLSGRTSMVTSIRLRQNRVEPTSCSPVHTRLGQAGAEACYPPFHADTECRAPYGKTHKLQFQYFDNEVNSTTGYPISMTDYKIAGDFGSYPLAGFWVWFSPPLEYNKSLLILELVREGGYIDDQTRALGLDIGVTLLDFVQEPIWANLNFLIEVSRAGRFVPLQPKVDINFYAQFEDSSKLDPTNRYDEYMQRLIADDNLNNLEECPILSLKTVLTPMYLAILPFVIYVVLFAVIGLVHDWKRYIQRPFILMEFAWATSAAGALGLLLTSLRFVDCGNSLFNQTLFDDVLANAQYEYAVHYSVRFEVLPMASVWTSARLVLGAAIVFHVFTFLKFLVNLKSLGVLVRTLLFATLELISFSISFLLLFSGFVGMFYYIYSIEATDFRTVVRTITTLWLGMIGELQITDELWRSGDFTVAIYIIFTFVSSFVLLTTIISIISRAHEHAQSPALRTQAPVSPRRQTHSSHQPTAPDDSAGRPGNGDTDTELVEEVDVMMRTLKSWQRHLATQRRRRMVVQDMTLTTRSSAHLDGNQDEVA